MGFKNDLKYVHFLIYRVTKSRMTQTFSLCLSLKDFFFHNSNTMNLERSRNSQNVCRLIYYAQWSFLDICLCLMDKAGSALHIQIHSSRCRWSHIPFVFVRHRKCHSERHSHNDLMYPHIVHLSSKVLCLALLLCLGDRLTCKNLLWMISP